MSQAALPHWQPSAHLNTSEPSLIPISSFITEELPLLTKLTLDNKLYTCQTELISVYS